MSNIRKSLLKIISRKSRSNIKNIKIFLCFSNLRNEFLILKIRLNFSFIYNS